MLALLFVPLALGMTGAGRAASAPAVQCTTYDPATGFDTTQLSSQGFLEPSGDHWVCTPAANGQLGSFTVPTGVSSVDVVAVGEPGQDGTAGSNCANLQNSPVGGSLGAPGGRSAELSGTLAVTAGAQFSVAAGAAGTVPLHGGAGGGGQGVPEDPGCSYDYGGNGGDGGGASYMSTAADGSSGYAFVAAGGGGGGGGNDSPPPDDGAVPEGCGPGAHGGDAGQDGVGRIVALCAFGGVTDGGGGAGAEPSGNGGDGAAAASFFAAGGGGAGGGGVNGGGGGLGGSLDGGAGGGGGTSLVPDGWSSTLCSCGPSVQITFASTSPPTTTIDLAGTSNNGWYTSAVTPTVTATDPVDANQVVVFFRGAISTNVESTRCVLDPGSVPTSFSQLPNSCSLPSSITTSGTHTIYAASDDWSGNVENVEKVTFKIDRTAPTTTIALSPSTPNGSNGWYTSPVTPSINATDNVNGSGVAGTRCTLQLLNDFFNSDYPCTQTVTDDGNWTFSAFSKDVAGNTESGPQRSFKIDQTPPTDAPLVSGSLGNNGWYTSDVSVGWNWSDALSGVDSNNCTSGGTTSGEGAAVTLDGSCKDLAGNTGTDSRSFKVDKTPPTISVAAVPASPNGSNGWYTSNVTAHFTCGDNLSGVVSCPTDQTLSTEGSSVSSTAETVNDNAGNTSAPSGVITVKIDKTAPSVAVTGVSSGATYTYGNVPAAGCSTSDAVSGVAIPATVAITGGSNGAGSFVATCAGGTDNAGNVAAPVSVSYTVLYAFGGFLNPPPKSTLTYQAGRTIPVSFKLTNSSGQPISTAVAATLGGKLTVTLSGQGITPTTAACSWNFVFGYFQCNVKTPTLSKIGAGFPYQVVASENLTGAPVTVPPYSSVWTDMNPETVSFTSSP